jgi:hypothetical protein
MTDVFRMKETSEVRLVRDRDVVVEQTPVRGPHAPITFRGYLPTFALSPAISVFSPLTNCSSV